MLFCLFELYPLLEVYEMVLLSCWGKEEKVISNFRSGYSLLHLRDSKSVLVLIPISLKLALRFMQ